MYPITLYNETESEHKLATNYALHRKSRHIDIGFNLIKDAVSKKIIKTEYLPTNEMLMN